MSSEVDCRSVGAWPAIIAAIIILVFLVGIAFIVDISSSSRGMTFLGVLIIGIIWTAIIYWMCVTGNHALGWLLLLIPFVLYVAWYIGKWLAEVTVPPGCVLNDAIISG